MTLEQRYTEQLQELGVYRRAFDPEIKLLCQMEREIRRIDKAWRRECPKDENGQAVPDYESRLYDRIVQLRKDILSHRDSLGLTPKGYKRLRPETTGADATAGDVHPFGDLLAQIAEQCRQYE